MFESAPTSVSFYFACLAIVMGGVVAWNNRRNGWGLPAMAVFATVAVWYVGDALYNDYKEYVVQLGADNLDTAWWQVTIFSVSFTLMTPAFSRGINAKIQHRGSMMMRYFETRKLEHPDVQLRISHAASGLFIAWGLLMGFALVRVDFDFQGLFAPYLGYKTEPWSRNRIGGGIDAILSLATYVQVFLTAGAGVVAAVARNRTTRTIAIAICCLGLPYYIFDRTRNTMLATVLPGLLAWVFLRLRGGIIVKVGVLAVAFLAVNAWFSFVMINRSDISIAAATASSSSRVEDAEIVDPKGKKLRGRHGGLNMFEELGWANLLMERGRYKPNFGARYFAELVNPIPRVIWKSKPLIGVDYAIARGQGGGDEGSGGMLASVSTGMIGQGVVNFGGFVGPIAAAMLMAGWVALLARQDFLGADPARLLLYATGLTLTFNLGRDITFLVVYPFLFGLVMLKVYYYLKPPLPEAPVRKMRRIRKKPVEVKSWRDDGAIKDDDTTEGIPHGRL